MRFCDIAPPPGAIRRRASPLKLIVGGVVGLVVGLFVGVLGANGAVQEYGLRSRGVATRAVVTDHQFVLRTRNLGSWTEHQIRYRFNVKGWPQPFTLSDTLPMWRTDLWTSVSEETWRAIQRDGTIQVVYLPDNPRANRPAWAGGKPMNGFVLFMVVGGIVAPWSLRSLLVGIRRCRSRASEYTSGGQGRFQTTGWSA